MKSLKISYLYDSKLILERFISILNIIELRREVDKLIKGYKNNIK